MGTANTYTTYTETTTTIGRTSLIVNSQSTRTINTVQGSDTETGIASLNMKYKVTQNEYLFIAEMDLKSVEKSLYILDSMIANNGKVTKGVLNDKTLSVKGVEMLFDINYGKGLSLYDADRLYQQEVVSPKRAEAWGLLGIKALGGGGGFSLERKSSKPSEVEVPSPNKSSTPKGEAVGETGNAMKQVFIKILMERLKCRLEMVIKFIHLPNLKWMN